MSGGAAVAVTLTQLLGYLGYVAVAGPLLFRVLVAPDRVLDRRAVRISLAGVGLLLLAAVARPLVMVVAAPGSVEARLAWPVALLQLGVAIAVLCYLPDLLDQQLSRWRRVVAAVAGGLLTVALLLPMILGATPRSAAGGALGVLHVLALGTWLGGMVLVAVLVLPADSSGPPTLAVLKTLLRRSRSVVLAAIAVLAVSGLVALLLQPGRVDGLTDAFWITLVLKAVLLVGLAAAAAHVRQQISRAAFRTEHGIGAGDVLAPLRRVVRVEIVVAAAVVAATAVLTVLTPLG